MARINLSFKITFKFILSFIILTIVLNSVYYIGVKNWMNFENTKNLESISQIIINEYQNNKDQDFNSSLSIYKDLEYYIYSEPSKELIASNSGLNILYNQHYFGSKWENIFKYGSPKWFYYETPFKVNNESILLVLRQSAMQEHNNLAILLTIGLCISLIMLIIVWVQSSKIAKKQLQPIKNITKRIQEFQPGDVTVRLDVQEGKGELKDFVLAFNKMMSSIQQLKHTQEQLLSALPKHMSIPSAYIVGYTKMYANEGEENVRKREAIKGVRREAEILQNFTQSLVACVLEDCNFLNINKENFKAKELIEETIDESKLIDNEHIYTVSIESNEWIYADKGKLKEVLRIYIVNSIKTVPTGEEISIKLYGTENEVHISIQSMNPELKGFISMFERLNRPEVSTPDQFNDEMALGHMMANSLIKHHEGRINIETKGKNNIITITLPRPIKDE